MEERHLSYRQLAYKTKLSAGYLNHLTKGTRPVPADPVIAVIAEALLRGAGLLRRVPPAAGRRRARRSSWPHRQALRHPAARQPVPDEIVQALVGLAPGNGNGDHGHAQGVVVGF